MKKGDWVRTPRFLTVKIETVFPSEREAQEAGFRETTHYWGDPEYGILGKQEGACHMVFAAFRK